MWDGHCAQTRDYARLRAALALLLQARSPWACQWCWVVLGEGERESAAPGPGWPGGGGGAGQRGWASTPPAANQAGQRRWLI